MRHLRGPTVPGFLLALLLGLGLLLPEVGHSLAHHHEAEHRSTSHAAPHQHDSADARLTGDHSTGDHPHLECIATLSAKPLLTHAVVVQAVVLALHDLDGARALPPVATTDLPPGDRTHGPPPPSRAPPQV